MGRSRMSFSWIAAGAAATALLWGAHPATAQRSVVIMEGHQPGTMTDSVGHFTLRGFPSGPQVLNIRQFGYLELTSTVIPPELPDVLVEIPLAPAPIMLEGVTAVVDHLATMKMAERPMALLPGLDQP